MVSAQSHVMGGFFKGASYPNGDYFRWIGIIESPVVPIVTWEGVCSCSHLGMDQYLLIPFLGEWTSIYQLFWCSPGVQGFDTLPFLFFQFLLFGGQHTGSWMHGWFITGSDPSVFHVRHTSFFVPLSFGSGVRGWCIEAEIGRFFRFFP